MPSMFPDFSRDAEHFGAENLSILDFHPFAIAQDHEPVWRPHAVLFFDQDEVGPELELVALIDSLRLRALPFLGNIKLPFPHDPVGPADEEQFLREKRHVVEGDRLAGKKPPRLSHSLSEDDEQNSQDGQER